MEKIIEIEGHSIGFKCSAGTVRAYRNECGRDLIEDTTLIESELVENQQLSPESVGNAEMIAYVMAKEYGQEMPPTVSEWLDNFSPYFAYNAIVHIINMWRENLKTINDSKKNTARPKENGLRRFFCLERRN